MIPPRGIKCTAETRLENAGQYYQHTRHIQGNVFSGKSQIFWFEDKPETANNQKELGYVLQDSEDLAL
jgi:hypothetical protein